MGGIWGYKPLVLLASEATEGSLDARRAERRDGAAVVFFFGAIPKGMARCGDGGRAVPRWQIVLRWCRRRVSRCLDLWRERCVELEQSGLLWRSYDLVW